MSIKHDHCEEIARELYATYTRAVGGVAFDGKVLPGASEFFGDPAKRKQADAWRMVAKEALPVIGRHALEDVKSYLAEKGGESSGWKKVLYWIGSIIAGGLVAWGLSGCGHDVVVTPDAAVITKDGSAVVIRKGFFSFNQGVPVSTPVGEPTVIVQEGK